jgi:predicted nucleic acid-binding protein
MMSKKSSKPKILLDCDVIIHFIKAGKQFLLPKIFPNQLVVLDKVKSELDKRKSNQLIINNFLEWSKIPIIPMPSDMDILREYMVLKKTKGDGEAACMAVARYTNDYIASSNLKDIADYCSEHGIVYYTTMDILFEAYKLGIMNEAECDQFIYEVKSKGSILINSINTIKEYKVLVEKK